MAEVFSDFIFEIQDLKTGEKSKVHETRLKFFVEKDYEVTTDCTEQIAFQEQEILASWMIFWTSVSKKISRKHRQDGKDMRMRNLVWEPLSNMQRRCTDEG